MTMTSTSMNYALDEVVSEVAWDEFYDGEFYLPFFYRVRGSTRARERTASFGGLGKYAVKNPTVAAEKDELTQEFEKTFVHSALAKTVEIERELVDDEDWGVLEEIGEELGFTARYTMEDDAAALFNDIAAGATYTSEDGLSIANAAHLNAAGGNSQANSGTNTLNQTGLGTTRVAMKAFKNARGLNILSMPDLLVVPTALEETGWEQTRSSGKPDSANNNMNFYNGQFSMVVWQFLTDTNAWGMIDSRLMRRNLLWYMRIMFETWGDGDFDTGTKRVGGYYRASHGCRDWRWIYWNNPS